MKELTMEEKMTLLIEINSLLATIPDYQLAMSESEMEYYHIFITDKGYIDRLYLEYLSFNSFCTTYPVRPAFAS